MKYIPYYHNNSKTTYYIYKAFLIFLLFLASGLNKLKPKIYNFNFFKLIFNLNNYFIAKYLCKANQKKFYH